MHNFLQCYLPTRIGECFADKKNRPETRNHQAYLLSVGKCNEPAVVEEVVVVVFVGVFVVVLVVVLPECIIFYIVTFPHASATILQTKNNNMIILWLRLLIRTRVRTKNTQG